MSNSNSEIISGNALLVGRLCIERALMHLAHLHALLHAGTPPHFSDSLEASSMRGVLESIERDLKSTAVALDFFE